MSNSPHILVIMTDQHRHDCLGCTGNPDVNTPHIDSLAADGTLYTNSFCPFPICTPSRYSFVTGLYARQHTAYHNGSTLPPATYTWPAALSQAGYNTACVGKMHYSPTYQDVGFDTMTLAEQCGPGRYDDDYHRYLMDKGLVDQNDMQDQVNKHREQADENYWSSFGALTSNLPEEHHSTTWIGRQAVNRISSWDSDTPQCLMASFIKPHHPFDPPPEWADAYNPDELTLLPGWTPAMPKDDEAYKPKNFFDYRTMTEAQLRQAMAYYYATISHIDEQVGTLIAALKANGQYDNTLILFTSDHGEFLGFHHMLLKAHRMYDPVVKVPLILKSPGNHTLPKTTDTLVNNIDIAPTILATAGCDIPSNLPGRSLLHQEDRPYVFSEMLYDRQIMVRSKTHKLTLCRRQEHNQLFDLVNDPQELTNCFNDPAYQTIQGELTTALHHWANFEAISPGYYQANAPTRQQPQGKPDAHEREAWFDSLYAEHHSSANADETPS